MSENLKLRVVKTRDDLLVTSSPTAPLFKNFVIGLGYADPGTDESNHACVTVGQTADDRLILVTEYLGIFADVLAECVDLKDRFWVDRLWLDGSDKGMVRMVVDFDGLTQYKTWGKDMLGRQIWQSHSSKFPYFRDRLAILYVTAVSPLIHSSPLGGIDEVVAMVKSGELSLHKDCSQCDWILSQQTVQEVIKKALARAMVYAVNSFKTFDGSHFARIMTPRPAYGNLK